MRVFLTGGSGLVGSHSIQQLVARGHIVTALARSPESASLVRNLGAIPRSGSIGRASDWDTCAGHDAIVHAAAKLPGCGSWEDYETANVTATRFGADAARRHGVRFVHVSSVAVYGRLAPRDGTLIGEDERGMIPEFDLYARSKRAAEDLVWSILGTDGAVALRPCVVYGERDRLMIPTAARALRLGWVPQIGDGTNKMSVVYAGHVASAICMAVEQTQFTGPVNVTTDGHGSLTQRQFFDCFQAALGRRLRRVRVNRQLGLAVAHLQAFILRTHRRSPTAAIDFLGRDNPYETTRLERELGWGPAHDAREALIRSIRSVCR